MLSKRKWEIVCVRMVNALIGSLVTFFSSLVAYGMYPPPPQVWWASGLAFVILLLTQLYGIFKDIEHDLTRKKGSDDSNTGGRSKFLIFI